MRVGFRLAALAAILCAGPFAVQGQTTSSPHSASAAPSIQRMDHVGINVTDLQKSAEWYERVLGFTIFHKWKTTWMISRGDMHIGLFLRPNAVKLADLDKTLAITHFAYATDAQGVSKMRKKS